MTIPKSIEPYYRAYQKKHKVSELNLILIRELLAGLAKIQYREDRRVKIKKAA